MDDDFFIHQSLPGAATAGAASPRFDDGGAFQDFACTPLNFDFDLTMMGADASSLNGPRKAHDDSCVGQPACPLNSSYTGPNSLTNANVNPHGHIAMGASRHPLPANVMSPFVAHLNALHSIEHLNLPYDVDLSRFIEPARRREQPGPSWPPPDYPSRPFSFLGRQYHGGDEDCMSIAGASTRSCMDSQCCQGVSCVGAPSACTDKECFPSSACTDKECFPSSACTNEDCFSASEVTSAAFALTRFNDGTEEQQGQQQQQQQQNGFHGQVPAMGQVSFPIGDDLHSEFISPHLLKLEFKHLVELHEDPLHPACADQSCPINDPKFFQECHFRHPTPDGDPQQQMDALLGSFLDTYGGNNFQVPDAHDGVECGIKLDSMEAYVKHFNDQHRHQLAVAATLSGQAALNSASMDASSHTSSVGSMTSTLNSTPGTSPLTPFSVNTEIFETARARRGHRQALSRSSSLSSRASQVTLQPGDEFRCFWCDSTDGVPCCQEFHNAEELHQHVIADHVSNLDKGPDGFCCGWEKCRRGEDGRAGFPQRSKIERHMQTHTGSKPHSCPICHKEFSAKQALDQHKLIHSDQKPLACPWPGCGKTFRQQSALTMHIRVHTGDKPLVCDICDRRFSESSNLSKHKRTHEVKGRFVCSFEGCGKDFHRQDQLRRHMKQHEGKGPAACSVTTGKGTSDPVVKNETPSPPVDLDLAAAKLADDRKFIVPPKPEMKPALVPFPQIRKSMTGVKKRAR